MYINSNRHISEPLGNVRLVSLPVGCRVVTGSSWPFLSQHNSHCHWTVKKGWGEIPVQAHPIPFQLLSWSSQALGQFVFSQGGYSECRSGSDDGERWSRQSMEGKEGKWEKQFLLLPGASWVRDFLRSSPVLPKNTLVTCPDPLLGNSPPPINIGVGEKPGKWGMHKWSAAAACVAS